MYCTYLTIYSGNKLPPFYIGYTSLKKLFKGYRGSVKSKIYKEIWKSELKENPYLFKTFILTKHETIPEALEKEVYFQKFFSVHANPMYINRAISSVKLYSRKGYKHSDRTKAMLKEKKHRQNSIRGF